MLSDARWLLCLSPPKLVLLRGNLGAGKTTLVKGIAEAFRRRVGRRRHQPHVYLDPRIPRTPGRLFHIDLYRVDTLRELETLGLDDLISENSILLIEWGEKFPRFERERDVEIVMESIGEDQRRIRLITDKA